MGKLKEGINEYISDDAYHADREYVSSSGLKMMSPLARKCNPRKFYKEYVLNEREEKKKSDGLIMGSYAHSLILEPDTVEKKYAIWEGGRRAGKDWKKFEEENADKDILVQNQAKIIQDLYDIYMEQKVIIGTHGYDEPVALNSFFNKGEAELTLCTELDGVKVKVRYDYFRQFSDFASIQDVKTTKDSIGTKSAIERICAGLDYDLSAALYVDVGMKLLNKPIDFYFMFMSKSDFEVKMVKASDQMLARGREKYKAGLQKLKEARQTGLYYSNEIMEIDSIE